MKLTKKQKKRVAVFSALCIVVIGLVVTVSVFLISRASIKGNWQCREKNITYTFEKKQHLSVKFEKEYLPVLETEYSGGLDGEYLISKADKTLSITLNYYNKSLTKEYSYEIKNNCLCLKNLDDGQTTIYDRIRE